LHTLLPSYQYSLRHITPEIDEVFYMRYRTVIYTIPVWEIFSKYMRKAGNVHRLCFIDELCTAFRARLVHCFWIKVITIKSIYGAIVGLSFVRIGVNLYFWDKASELHKTHSIYNDVW